MDSSGVRLLRNPIRGTLACWARAASGQPTAAPPKDDTSFATQTLSFDLVPITTTESFQQPATTTPQFVPVVTTAQIYVESLHQYLTFLWVPEPRTLVRGLHKLPAGHYAILAGDGRLDLHQYWDLTYPRADSGYHMSEEELSHELTPFAECAF